MLLMVIIVTEVDIKKQNYGMSVLLLTADLIINRQLKGSLKSAEYNIDFTFI